MQVEINRETAKALYERLLKPEKDAHGNAVYTVSLTLARELRENLDYAMRVFPDSELGGK
jgi:hypothetical protein